MPGYAKVAEYQAWNNGVEIQATYSTMFITKDARGERSGGDTLHFSAGTRTSTLA